jgi:hypothetical protein
VAGAGDRALDAQPQVGDEAHAAALAVRGVDAERVALHAVPARGVRPYSNIGSQSISICAWPWTHVIVRTRQW